MTHCPTIPVRLAAGAILLIGIVSAAVIATRTDVREPELNGIPLSHFLDKQTYGELRTERDASESIRLIEATPIETGGLR